MEKQIRVFITELAIINNINIVQYYHLQTQWHIVTLNISLLHSNSYTLTP